MNIYRYNARNGVLSRILNYFCMRSTRYSAESSCGEVTSVIRYSVEPRMQYAEETYSPFRYSVLICPCAYARSYPNSSVSNRPPVKSIYTLASNLRMPPYLKSARTSTEVPLYSYSVNAQEALSAHSKGKNISVCKA